MELSPAPQPVNAAHGGTEARTVDITNRKSVQDSNEAAQEDIGYGIMHHHRGTMHMNVHPATEKYQCAMKTVEISDGCDKGTITKKSKRPCTPLEGWWTSAANDHPCSAM